MAKRKRTVPQHRFPTPDEMFILDSLLDAGSQGVVALPEWRKMRQLACRMKYEEREGKIHPAWDGLDEIDPLTHDDFLALVQPPPGMLWQEFGRRWDLAPQPDETGQWEVILRHADIQGQWRGRMMQTATPLETRLVVSTPEPDPVE